jgi:hypothetical protein
MASPAPVAALLACTPQLHVPPAPAAPPPLHAPLPPCAPLLALPPHALQLPHARPPVVAMPVVASPPATDKSTAIANELAKLKSAQMELESANANYRMAATLLLRPDSTGVEPLAVPPQMAERAARHLQEHWRDGKLELGSTYAYGYNEYGKTLTEHNKKQQQLETLLLSHSLLPQTRRCVPGFKEIEDYLASYLQVGSHVAAVPALTLRPCPDPTSLP